MLSGLMYFVQSLEGGNGYALARFGMPMVFIAVVVVITSQVSLLATNQATTMAMIGGICDIVYTFWAINLRWGMISK
tara:strand:+ start:379 stop:609 length:231 start_codon:yes stop_codon:yes gene_type:complete